MRGTQDQPTIHRRGRGTEQPDVNSSHRAGCDRKQFFDGGELMEWSMKILRRKELPESPVTQRVEGVKPQWYIKCRTLDSIKKGCRH
jgi:hypothetical protein